MKFNFHKLFAVFYFAECCEELLVAFSTDLPSSTFLISYFHSKQSNLKLLITEGSEIKNNFLWNDFGGRADESETDEFFFKCKFYSSLKWKTLKLISKRDSI